MFELIDEMGGEGGLFGGKQNYCFYIICFWIRDFEKKMRDYVVL